MEPIEKKYLEMLKMYRRKGKRWWLFVPWGMKFRGLCAYAEKHNLSCFLNHRLEETVGNSMFPFGLKNYIRRHENLTQHLCPTRNAWIDEEIARFEKL